MAKVTVLFGAEPQGEHTLDQDEMKVGRAMDCQIVVDNLGVSRHHCTIVRDGNGFAVVDGGSNNGTYVGGQRITRHVLADGDRIVLGKHSLVFDAQGTAAPAAAKKGQAMGGEMTMFVDQAVLAKAMASAAPGAKRMSLIVLQGGREVAVPLLKEETTIGRSGDVPVQGFLVKPVQAKVVKSGAAYRIVAAGGWRSVRVNGAKISDTQLNPGDTIVIAGTSIAYR